MSVINKKSPSVLKSRSQAYKDNIEKNRASILSIINIIIVLGKRNIAFRGNWNKETSEDRNFMFFVNWKANFDQVLQDHIQKEASYGKYPQLHRIS